MERRDRITPHGDEARVCVPQGVIADLYEGTLLNTDRSALQSLDNFLLYNFILCMA
jgi:hypothetical protein